MKRTVSQYDFIDAFKGMDGEIDPQHGFTRAGLFALYDFLIEFEEDCGLELELDPIAFRCEFSEYPSVEDAVDSLGLETEDDLDIVITFNDGVIIRG